jgi:hypothetical protein
MKALMGKVKPKRMPFLKAPSLAVLKLEQQKTCNKSMLICSVAYMISQVK